MNKLRVGIDIIKIRRFANLVEKQKDTFLKKIFNLEEIKDKRVEHLAGIFCVKEALVKAGVIKVGRWRDVSIINQKSGCPNLVFRNKEVERDISQADISISHDGGYAVGTAVVEFKNKSS
jgi:phosphopantetheine--protein transferase-like protein